MKKYILALAVCAISAACSDKKIDSVNPTQNNQQQSQSNTSPNHLDVTINSKNTDTNDSKNSTEVKSKNLITQNNKSSKDAQINDDFKNNSNQTLTESKKPEWQQRKEERQKQIDKFTSDLRGRQQDINQQHTARFNDQIKYMEIQLEKMKVIRDHQKSEGNDVKKFDEGITQLEQTLNQLRKNQQ